MDVFGGKNRRHREQLTKFGGNKVLRSRPRAAMFVMSFANYKSRVIHRADVRVRAQASYGNITILSHLKIDHS